MYFQSVKFWNPTSSSIKAIQKVTSRLARGSTFGCQWTRSARFHKLRVRGDLLCLVLAGDKWFHLASSPQNIFPHNMYMFTRSFVTLSFFLFPAGADFAATGAGGAKLKAFARRSAAALRTCSMTCWEIDHGKPDWDNQQEKYNLLTELTCIPCAFWPSSSRGNLLEEAMPKANLPAWSQKCFR